MMLRAAARSGGNLSLSCEFFCKFVWGPGIQIHKVWLCWVSLSEPPPLLLSLPGCGCWQVEFRLLNFDACGSPRSPLQYLTPSLSLHINEPAHYADCAGEEELHTVCFIIRLYKHPQNLSSSPAPVALSPAALQTGSSLNVIWAPTAGQAPPQSGHLP